jgi:hypothetical protein
MPKNYFNNSDVYAPLLQFDVIIALSSNNDGYTINELTELLNKNNLEGTQYYNLKNRIQHVLYALHHSNRATRRAERTDKFKTEIRYFFNNNFYNN